MDRIIKIAKKIISKLQIKSNSMWITDTGELLQAQYQKHSEEAIKYLKSKNVKEVAKFKCKDEVYVFVMKKGWARVVITGDVLSIDYRPNFITTEAKHTLNRLMEDNKFGYYSLDIPGHSIETDQEDKALEKINE